MRDLQVDIGRWQRHAFSNTDGVYDVNSHFKKLEKEFDELRLALFTSDYKSGDGVADELADVAILLLGLADHVNVDLGEAIRDKLAKNKSRTWKPSGDGTYQHTEEA